MKNNLKPDICTSLNCSSYGCAYCAECSHALYLGEAIDIDADVETEKVKCPEKDDKLITRAECLDYSGSHHEECNGCENKAITQNALLGQS